MLVAPKALVSMMSAPASKKRRWMSQIIFGCVSENKSPLFSRSLRESLKRSARMSASVMPYVRMVVPIAPSMMAMRFWSNFWIGCRFGMVQDGFGSAELLSSALGWRWQLFADREHDFKVRFFGLTRGYFGGFDVE